MGLEAVRSAANLLNTPRAAERPINWFDLKPPICGIYFLLRNERVVYVGQSVDIEARIRSHVNERVKGFAGACYIECDEGYLNEAEEHFIRLLNPEYNRPSSRTSVTPDRVALVTQAALEILHGHGVCGLCFRDLAMFTANRLGPWVDGNLVRRCVDRSKRAVWDTARAVYVHVEHFSEPDLHTPCTNSYINVR